jgi:roadblock/LC7 domain-containing protein
VKKVNEKIEEIVKLKGVVSVGVTDEEGNLFRLEGVIGGAQAQWLAKTGRVNSALARAEAHAWLLASKEASHQEAPAEVSGWLMAGPTFTFIVVRRYGVMVKNSETDFNKVIKVLLEL